MIKDNGINETVNEGDPSGADIDVIDGIVDAIKLKTDLIPADIGTQLDTNIPAIKTNVESLLSYIASLGFKTIGTGTFTTDSATVPRDNTRTEAINYFDSCWLVPTAGAEANQPRQIFSYAANGTFTMVSGSTWLTAPGLVAYKILSNGTGKNVMAMGTLTLSSTSVPEDNRRAEVNNYWNGCQILPSIKQISYLYSHLFHRFLKFHNQKESAIHQNRYY